LDALDGFAKVRIVRDPYGPRRRVELLANTDGGRRDCLLLPKCGLGLGCWVLAHLVILSMSLGASIALCRHRSGAA
jgi:hypothetical protein